MLTEEHKEALLTHLSQSPASGDIIPESGGIRKLRWAARGKGKRGGVRVIYYFHSGDMPLVLLTVYAKSQKSDLTAEEKRELRSLVPELVRQLLRRKGK